MFCDSVMSSYAVVPSLNWVGGKDGDVILGI